MKAKLKPAHLIIALVILLGLAGFAVVSIHSVDAESIEVKAERKASKIDKIVYGSEYQDPEIKRERAKSRQDEDAADSEASESEAGDN